VKKITMSNIPPSILVKSDINRTSLRRHPYINLTVTHPTHPSPLAIRLFEGLSEEEELDLVVQRQHTGTSNTTEDVGTSTLEERLNTLGLDNRGESVHGGLVLDGLTGSL